MRHIPGAIAACILSLSGLAAADLPEGYGSWKEVIFSAALNSSGTPFSATADSLFSPFADILPGAVLSKGANSEGITAFRVDLTVATGDELAFLNIDSQCYLLTKSNGVFYRLEIEKYSQGNIAAALPIVMREVFLRAVEMAGRTIDSATACEVSETAFNGRPAWKILVKYPLTDVQIAAFGVSRGLNPEKRAAIVAQLPDTLEFVIDRGSRMIVGVASYTPDGFRKESVQFDRIDVNPDYPDGFFDIPPGKLATLKTQEELKAVVAALKKDAPSTRIIIRNSLIIIVLAVAFCMAALAAVKIMKKRAHISPTKGRGA